MAVNTFDTTTDLMASVTLSLGVYPAITLKEAREKRDTAIKQIAGGINPSITRKIEKAGSIENTFKAVAEDFLMTKLKGDWSESHHKHVKECFERDVYPWLGKRPLKELSAVEVPVNKPFSAPPLKPESRFQWTLNSLRFLRQ